MIFDILTIFPEAFDSYFKISIIKRAQKKGLIKINIHNIRDYAIDKHKMVDDKPYGGGPGMVMKIEPIWRTLKKIRAEKAKSVKQKIVLLTPSGETFNQKTAKQFSKLKRIILICGHYEGVDERVNNLVDEKISVGDYILSGGELAAMIIVDAVTRLTPKVLGNFDSLKEESFNYPTSLEYAQYTRPEIFSPQKNVKWAVPKVLLSGNHKKIQNWQQKHIKVKK